MGCAAGESPCKIQSNIARPLLWCIMKRLYFDPVRVMVNGTADVINKRLNELWYLCTEYWNLEMKILHVMMIFYHLATNRCRVAYNSFGGFFFTAVLRHSPLCNSAAAVLSVYFYNASRGGDSKDIDTIGR